MLLSRKVYDTRNPLKVVKEDSIKVTNNTLKRVGDGFLTGEAMYNIKKHKKATVIKGTTMIEYTLS